MNKIKVLDCTFRDGGYYNDWDFDFDSAMETVDALCESGVDIIELGYKSRAQNKYFGLFKYCPEEVLSSLYDRKIEFSFMLDVKEFIEDGHLNRKALLECIPPSSESIFTWCRIASYHKTIEFLNDISQIIKDELGYKIAFNYMAASSLQWDILESSLELIDGKKFEYIYFADSFGNFETLDVIKYVELFRNSFGDKIGFHAHDNMGLAFSNVITAIDAGVKIIDSTIMGMGRGAGNLKTEQLLLYLASKNDSTSNLNPYPLLDIIHNYFQELHQEYKWGWDFSYMLSGIHNIHPTYCQNLKSTHKYSISEISGILSNIDLKEKSSFNKSVLNNAILANMNSDNSKIEKYNYADNKSENVIIAARGSSLNSNISYLSHIKELLKADIFECNDTNLLQGFERIVVVLNNIRLLEINQQNINKNVKQIITGVPSIESGFEHIDIVRHLEFQLSEEIKINHDLVTIPEYIVGMYAISIAVVSGAKKIYLLGFDGYEASSQYFSEQEKMQRFFEKFRKKFQNIELISLAKTNYTISCQSIFSFLK